MPETKSAQVIERHHGELVSIDNPTTTLEELFLTIVRDSEARPGRRACERRQTVASRRINASDSCRPLSRR